MSANKKTFLFLTSSPSGGYQKQFGNEEYVYFTPAEAKLFLEKYANNIRDINAISVDKYRRLMNSGAWKPEIYNAVVIGKDGKVIDGHHRLTACSLSENGAWMRIIRDVPEEMRYLIDTNQYSRKPYQAVSASGTNIKAVESATYNALAKYANRKFNPNKKRTLDAVQLQEVLDSDLRDVYNKAEAIVASSLSAVRSIDQHQHVATGLSNAIFKATLVLALANDVDTTALQILIEAVLSQSPNIADLSDNHVASIQKLRNAFGGKRNSEAERQKFTETMERLLYAFMEGRNPTSNARHDSVDWQVPLVGTKKENDKDG